METSSKNMENSMNSAQKKNSSKMQQITDFSSKM